jgi:hypothetical protein
MKSNGRKISTSMKWKGFGSKILTRNFPGRAEENHEMLQSRRPVSGVNLKARPPEYEPLGSCVCFYVRQNVTSAVRGVRLTVA